MAHQREWAVVPGITGGTGGACARALAAQPGLNILGIHRGRYPEAAERISREVAGHGVKCHMRVASAATAQEVEAAAAEIQEVVGEKGVKVFLHAMADASYGCFAANPNKMLHQKQVAKTFEVMAHSFVYWTQELVRRNLLADNATLMAFTNPFADSVVHGWGLIAAAKAALGIYVRQLADELGPRGHRVTLLKFGLVETEAIRIAFTPEAWNELKERISRLVPYGRLTTVDEVGHLVSHLISDGFEWFNGACIDFSGGQANALLNPVFNPGSYPEFYGRKQ